MTQFAIPIESATAATVNIGGIAYPATAVVENFYPTTISLAADALRMTTIDLAPLGDADSITVSGISAGRIVARGNQEFDVDLIQVTATDDVTFNYVATKSGTNISGVCTLTVNPATSEFGWGTGLHYTFPTDSNNAYIVEPGSSHRKVYVSPTGITLAELQGEIPGASANGFYLRDNIVPAALGGNGVLRYGETPAVALDAQLGSRLWNTITGTKLTPNSNWLLFERGGNYATFSMAISEARGEGPLHPILIGAYGTGDKPEIPGVGSDGGAQFYIYQDVSFITKPQPGPLIGLILDGITVDHPASEMSPSVTHFRSTHTFRRFKSTNALKDPPIANEFWHWKSQRASNVYTGGGSDFLVEYCFFSKAGWEEGYVSRPVAERGLYPVTESKPPDIFSHNIYVPNKGQAGNRGIRFRRSIFLEGSLTGLQLRPGGIAKDNIFAGSNLGLLNGGGSVDPLTGLKGGSFSYTCHNLFTWAGQRTGMENMERAAAIAINAPDTILLDNVVCNSGPGNDGVYAHGVAPIDSIPFKVAFNLNNDTQRGSIKFDNSVVRNWVGSANDANLSGVDTATLDARSMATWATLKTGTTKTYNRDATEYLESLAEPWTMLPELFDYFGGPAGRGWVIRTTPIAAVFRPDARGITPGFHWSEEYDWNGGAVPGTVAGDTADIAGYWVTNFETVALTSLHLRGGIYQAAGGRMTTGDILSGGQIKLSGSGTVVTDGFTSSELVTVELMNGRFVNTGTIAGNLDVTVQNYAEAVLGYDGASCTIAAGRTLRVVGHRCKVGVDGVAGGTAGLTINGTLTIAPTLEIDYTGNLEVAGGHLQVTVGNAINGETSGATGRVIRSEFITPRTMGVTTAGYNQENVGFVNIENWTGSFTVGEPLNHLGTRLQRIMAAPGLLGTVHRTTIHHPLPLESTGRGMIQKFKMNGDATQSVTFPLVLGAGSTLNVDVRGLVPGAYCIAIADTITGTFTNVNVTNGAATVDYSVAGKIILNVT